MLCLECPSCLVFLIKSPSFIKAYLTVTFLGLFPRPVALALSPHPWYLECLLCSHSSLSSGPCHTAWPLRVCSLSPADTVNYAVVARMAHHSSDVTASRPGLGTRQAITKCLRMMESHHFITCEGTGFPRRNPREAVKGRAGSRCGKQGSCRVEETQKSKHRACICIPPRDKGGTGVRTVL